MVERMADGISDALISRRRPRPRHRQHRQRPDAGVGQERRASAWRRSSPPCLLAGVLVNLAQVGIRPKTQALKPNFRRLNPKSGLQRIVGKHGLVELVKNLLKISILLWVVLSALLPHIQDFASMVGMSPLQFGTEAAAMVKSIAYRATFAYLAIGVLDFFYQRYDNEKSMRMKKEEVKEEGKGQDLPAEVKGAIRRRQREAARARMMDDVPTADVIVTNPTHYSVALKYDGHSAAPRGRRQGQGPHRPAHPRDRQGARRPDRPRPAAGARAARQRRGRPADPRGAVRRRGADPRLRLPRRRPPPARHRLEDHSHG